MPKYTIAKYIRLSLEDVKYDSLSISNQNLLIDRHIDTLEFTPDTEVEVIEFVDNGYSGLNFERPAVQKLLNLVRESKIDCIIVKDFSRFGRNSIETGYFIERVFPLFHTRFISISDGFNSEDYKEDTGGLQVAFKFLMHEYYSHDMSKKSKTAKYAKFTRGEYFSKKCLYGYRLNNERRWEIDEEAAVAVRFIFEQALMLKSAQAVSKALFEKKIIPPGEYLKSKGKDYHDVSRSIGIWQRSSILRILDDERYTGTYIIGKRAVTEIGGRKSRLKPESEWIKIPEHHPAIVSRELYDQVQAAILKFKCPKTKRPDYPLKSKVICGCCHHTMQRAPRLQRAFVCRYTKVNEAAECYNMEIDEKELEDLIFEKISNHAQVIMNKDRGDYSNIPLHIEQQSVYEKRIALLREEKRQFYESLILGSMTEDVYKAKKAAVDNELSQLIKAYDLIKAEIAVLVVAKTSADELRISAESAYREKKLSRAIVELLISNVYIYPGKQVEIKWKDAGFASNNKEDSKYV